MTGHSEQQETATTRLDDLIGRVLSAVVFVQDYLQLQFDGSVLTLLVWPVVAVGAAETSFGSPGYRDLLGPSIVVPRGASGPVPADSGLGVKYVGGSGALG